MTNAQLIRAAMSATGQSARGLARLIGVDERTMRRWLADESPVPGPALALFRILRAEPHTLLLMGD
jgi:DNA-binding transcriptional regulator YiaG